TSAGPVVIAPFEPHDCVPSTLFGGMVLLLDDSGVMPGPAAATDPPMLSVDGTGALRLKPAGKVHFANVRPQRPVPGGGALLTVSAAVALWPVSMVPMKRSFVVLVSVPVAVGVTLTLMTQLLFAASVPLEKA